MNKRTKTRLYLFFGSVITLLIVSAFLAILNINEPHEYTNLPFSVLRILVVIAGISLALFFWKGPVFDIQGRLKSVNINAMLVTLLIVIQVSFFFEIVSVRNQTLNYQIYTDIREAITLAENCDDNDLNEVLSGACKHAIKEISVVDEENKINYSSESAKIGSESAGSTNSYAFGRVYKIKFTIDRSYIHNQLRSIILNLITVLITSLFFSVEMVIFMIRMVSRNLLDSVADEDSGIVTSNDKAVMKPLYYIRQIAFLFYFASRLSAAFIPIMAKSMINPFPWISDTTAAGLPQISETMLTCSAIFITTVILERKGWKLPFISGLVMVALGTFMSAFSANLLIFVLARAVVGLGYGFCWMTLRNLSLFGRNDKEQLLGFALLNAGIYAGMNCGASLGAIFADIFGYKLVFIASAIMTVLTSFFIIRMENERLPHREEHVNETEKKEKHSGFDPQMVAAVLFVVLMIAPASIAASYLSYFLPLYFESIGKSVTDVGRAQLLYGLVIVYLGPFVSMIIASLRKKQLKAINVAYNLMISLSLFIPGVALGHLPAFAGAGVLGLADSYGFGVQNNYFLALPAVRKMGASKSLSVLSFIKKILEMVGPLVFAGFIVFGYSTGIRFMALIFAFMMIIFIISDSMMRRRT